MFFKSKHSLLSATLNPLTLFLGATDTKMVRRTLKKVMGPVYGADKTEDELLEHVKKHIPLGRLGEPRDVANSVIFFLSSLSSFVTGQVLVVGGGA